MINGGDIVPLDRVMNKKATKGTEDQNTFISISNKKSGRQPVHMYDAKCNELFFWKYYADNEG